MGGPAARALSVFVALSAFGNVLSVVFSQSRIVQELGREGITPFHRFFASNWPFNAPSAGLFWQFVTTSVVILAPPPGDAYSLILNMISYPLNAVNLFVGFGLFYLYFFRAEWSPPWRCSWPVALFFGTANLYLLVAPLIPPSGTRTVYQNLPYWLHVVIGWGVILAGGVYYLVWVKILPRIGGYRLDRETTYDKLAGWERHHFVKKYDN
jgi:amino acid transporter